MVRDPVSGNLLDPRAAVATREHGGQVLYFESEESVMEFDNDPHYYGHPEPEEDLADHHNH